MDRDATMGRRAALEARWLVLMRTELPGMARDRRWPVSLDHCFMRICLDNALGRPWLQVVQPPAYRHLTDDALCRAIQLAEDIAADPAILDGLNRTSLQLRGKRLPPPGRG